MNTATRTRRRGFALVLIGLVLGAALWASPATSHVATWAHNWTKHIRPKTDARYYTKAQANARYSPTSAVAGIRVSVTSPAEGDLLNANGNVIRGSCGGGAGTIQYRNDTGATARIMGPNTSTDVANGAAVIFPSATAVTPLVQTVQAAWGPVLERVTTFTVSWTAASGACEWLVSAVTSR